MKLKLSAVMGETVFHDPYNQYPFSIQLVDGNKLAQLTRINVVCDFRRMDMAYGGQRCLHNSSISSLFLSSNRTRVILNLGGIANITILNPNTSKVIGFDTGPGKLA